MDITNKTYTARLDTEAVVQDWDNAVIGPENTDLWSDYQSWLAAGNLPNPVYSPVPLFDYNLVNAECSKRIYAYASDNTQKNMTANFVAGNFSDADKQAYINGVNWIHDMQLVCRNLIINQDETFTDDSHWPIPSQDAIDLSNRY